MKTERRSTIKKLLVSIPALAGIVYLGNAKSNLEEENWVGKTIGFQEVSLLSRHIQHNNLVYLGGRGAHDDGRSRKNIPFDIKSHTEIVLQELEKELVMAGSSMEKVLKVSVFLSDIANY